VNSPSQPTAQNKGTDLSANSSVRPTVHRAKNPNATTINKLVLAFFIFSLSEKIVNIYSAQISQSAFNVPSPSKRGEKVDTELLTGFGSGSKRIGYCFFYDVGDSSE
jgi:hypothetical protein